MEEKSNAFLEREPVGKLMGKYAVPVLFPCWWPGK